MKPDMLIRWEKLEDNRILWLNNMYQTFEQCLAYNISA